MTLGTGGAPMPRGSARPVAGSRPPSPASRTWRSSPSQKAGIESARDRHEARAAVGHAAAAPSGDNAQRDPHRDRDRHRDEHQLEGRHHAIADRAEHRLLGRRATSPSRRVSEVAHVGEVLLGRPGGRARAASSPGRSPPGGREARCRRPRGREGTTRASVNVTTTTPTSVERARRGVAVRENAACGDSPASRSPVFG